MLSRAISASILAAQRKRHFVKLKVLALSVLCCAALAMPAAAQIYPNDEVIVNPSATGSQVLLYPGGKYGRVTGQLLQPGEPDPNAPIHLHMPVHHAVRHVTHVTRAKPKTEEASIAAEQPRPVKIQRAPAPKPRAPSPQPQEAMSFSDIPSESASSLVAPAKTAVTKKPAAIPQQHTPAPSKVAAAKKPLKEVSLPGAAPSEPMGFLSGTDAAPTPAPSKPARVASLEPTPSSTHDLSPRNSIAFAPGAEEPAPAVLDTVKALSGDLNNALSNGSARIQLEAYGGKQGDKGSDARRLSLKRALIIRQLLIDNGIPSERIDVRAMGGASGGALDRVDIFVRA